MDGAIGNLHLHIERTPHLPPGLSRLAWRGDAIGQGLAELARRAGLRPGTDPVAAAPVTGPPGADPGTWLDWAAGHIGVEAEAVEFPATTCARDIAAAGPAVLSLRDGPDSVFLLLLRGRRGRVLLLAPDLTVHARPPAEIAAAARARLEAPLADDIEHLLDLTSPRAGKRVRVRAALLDERLADARIDGCWLLRPPATAPFDFQLRQAGLARRLGGILLLLLGLYGLEIGGWAVIGNAALGGRLDMAWLAAWLLLIVSVVPFQLAMRWLNATFALDLGRLLKRRLLVGALRLPIDAVRHQGVGQLLGRVIEAQALETLVLNGGIGLAVAAVELLFAAWILSAGASGMAHVALLAVWLAATALLCRRYFLRLRAWSATRMALTHDLVERMVGHRTRLAQEWPHRRDASDDQAMGEYLSVSRAIDDAVLPLGASASGGWKLAALLGCAPIFAAGGATPVGIAITIGGMLLANRAFTGIANAIGSLAQARVAWDLVSDLFHAGGATVEPTPIDPAAMAPGPAPLVEASDLVFRYRAEGAPVLRGLDLTIRHGERVLIQGASGGGKSTLAALLTGLRAPSSGLLLLNGLDRHTLGAGWHRWATEAPQFHENHILSGPFAFNVLMGRTWPPSERDLADALSVCHELGLGDLLARMPAGIMQPIGETGWQLSHGERSRLFLARALLQDTSLTILDESFAALDAESVKLCMACAFRRAKTLVVIAHP